MLGIEPQRIFRQRLGFFRSHRSWCRRYWASIPCCNIYKRGAEFVNRLSETAKWMIFSVAALTLGYVAYSLASKLLDPLYDSYARRRRVQGDPLLELAIRKAELQVPGISKSKHSIYDWAKGRVEEKSASFAGDLALWQGVSKMFRSFCMGFLLVALAMAYLRLPLLFCLFILAAVLSFIVFCERRWHATCQVYMRNANLPDDDTTTPRIIIGK